MAQMYRHQEKNAPLYFQINPDWRHILLHEGVLWRFLILLALAYIVWAGRISISLDFSNLPVRTAQIAEPAVTQLTHWMDERTQPALALHAEPVQNFTFAVDPAYAKRKQIDRKTVEKGMEKCRSYVERFAPVARAEMVKYGIPASVTLAQALLESDAGESALAKQANNHFGLKCMSKNCKKGHCANFTDDTHKDFFVKYANIWSSYRAHSQLLKQTPRYAHLFQLGHRDYRSWAKGLAKAGYASDKRYAEKLIALIESLQLDRFDAPN